MRSWPCIVVVALVVVSLFTACGADKTAADPFVGTWRTAWSEPLVIAKTADGYLAVFPLPLPAHKISLQRRGDDLVGIFTDGKDTLRAEASISPGSDYLVWGTAETRDGPIHATTKLQKVSPSTAWPSEAP